MNSLKVGIIINGSIENSLPEKKRLSYQLQKISKKQKIEIFYEITHSKEEIIRCLTEYKRHNFKVLAIAGGDGTLHYSLNAAIEIWKTNKIPPILILPLGKMNLIAKDIGYKINPTKLINIVIKKIQKDRKLEYTKRQSLSIANNICFMFGTGTITGFYQLLKFHSKKKVKTLRFFCRIIFQQIFTGKFSDLFHTNDLHLQIQDSHTEHQSPEQLNTEEKEMKPDSSNEIEDNIIEDENCMFLAQTIRSSYFPFKPAFNAVDLNDEFVIVSSKFSFSSFVSRLPFFFLNWKMESKKFLRQKVKYCRLEWLSGMNFYTDGELYQSKIQEIKLGPKIKFIKTWK